MGKSISFRYSVSLVTLTGYNTPAAWATKSRVGYPIPKGMGGPPTAAKLARYVADYNASLLVSGVNSHIGPNGRCVRAFITDHATNAAVAVWESRS